jgi:hypothetical protein
VVDFRVALPETELGTTSGQLESENFVDFPCKRHHQSTTPQTMSELHSHLHEELELRLAEAESVGYGFDLPKAAVAPNAPRKCSVKPEDEIAA